MPIIEDARHLAKYRVLVGMMLHSPTSVKSFLLPTLRPQLRRLCTCLLAGVLMLVTPSRGCTVDANPEPGIWRAPPAPTVRLLAHRLAPSRCSAVVIIHVAGLISRVRSREGT